MARLVIHRSPLSSDTGHSHTGGDVTERADYDGALPEVDARSATSGEGVRSTPWPGEPAAPGAVERFRGRGTFGEHLGC
jgi:hypothetical protein